MGGLLILAGIIYIIYNLVKEAATPTQTGKLNWERFNQDSMSGKYTSKQLGKRMDKGMYHDNK